MKKLSDILIEATAVAEEIVNTNTNVIVPPVTASTVDRVGSALQKLDQIGEMVDDLYNTLSHLEEIDAETDASLTGTYNSMDDLYAKVDEKYDVIPVDLEEYEVEESLELDDENDLFEASIYDPVQRHNANPIPKKLKALGFVEAPVGNSTWKPSTGNVISLYGLAMRAGKWADVFYAVTDDKKPYTIINTDGVQRFSNESDAIRSLTKKVDEQIEMYEELSADSPASEWIDDFIKSDAPQFKGKTKKERIKMALGAYYGAQKNEEIELDEAIMSPKQRADAQRVQYGAMSRDEYEKKWELGKYKSQGNKLSGPGGLYKNLVKSSVHKEEIELDEATNMSKIKELVALSLIDEKDVPATIAALKATQTEGKPLTPAQTKLLGNLAVMLTNVILGDTAALSSVKRAAKE